MRKRQAFTLVEMLVAMALTLFVMAILSQCFVTSLEVFSQLKGIGDMQDGIRVTTNALRADLSLPHFEGGKRMSDGDFWNNPQRIGFNGLLVDSATREGFFHIRQGGIPGIDAGSKFEGQDADALESFRAANHMIF